MGIKYDNVGADLRLGEIALIVEVDSCTIER